jgi:hypothetical protein
MDVMSTIIIVLVVLYGVLGYMRGFFNILLGILKSLSSFLISFFLAKPFGNLLFKLGFGDIFTRKIEETLIGSNDLFSVVITTDNKEEVLRNALEGLKIPEFLHDLFSSLGSNLIGNLEGHTVGYYISVSAASLCCVVIAFVFLLAFSGTIIFLMRKVFNKLTRIGIISITNRIVGAVVNMTFILLTISFIFWGIATLTTFMPSLNVMVIGLFGLDNNDFSIAKWMYENNLFIKLFELFVK